MDTVLRRGLSRCRWIGMIAIMAFLAGCWKSEMLLFDEEEFADPWGGDFQIAMVATFGPGEGQAVHLEPDGKWFKLTDDKGDSSLMAFVPGEYDGQTGNYHYLTVVIKEEGEDRAYKYGVGKLTDDGRELGVCGLANTQEVASRKMLVSAIRAAVLADQTGGEPSLTCGKLTELMPVKDKLDSPQPNIFQDKYKALRDMEKIAKAAHSEGRSSLAQRFIQLVGPDVECAGSYLGKIAFPEQGPDGDYWKLMVVYLGEQTDETVHGPDFANCGEAVLAARKSIAFTKLDVPYRIIAIDRNFQVFLDSGVTQ